ncbi:hypothetical protein [Pyrobaculum aerophilum]|uniref:Uncharacterized protein n=3 Tax=Pyrobaculum aerophilum TaxID=13773 RepID=Q8ZXR7_PYRAE|nr:hypothetical protein [Pyrobaculum aerophilum]AAL63279.1 hypothetical protein PAE1141 [Pyrobaculum aerophilum str. IM2]MCX8136838.1 hypothetical protein [Pyrobaculum aerophilum]RFA98178.1 hypothetical protein CGL52_07950 [Pyrobaculum aerophilum]HII47889.1 hypothetical protein [Pyrobaculum aerophilum]
MGYYYCDFDAAAAAVDSMLSELVREHFGDMPRGELDAIREFVFRDFMHYLATRAGIYNWKRFSENNARLRLCMYVEKMWNKLWDIANEWFNLWKLKWNQRVRLVFSEEEFKKATQSVKWNSALEEVLKKINLTELRLFVIANLIRNGEVAGVEQIAEYLIRDELNSIVERHGPQKAAEMYKSGALASRLLERISSLKNFTDPLLLLKFDFGRIQSY